MFLLINALMEQRQPRGESAAPLFAGALVVAGAKVHGLYTEQFRLTPGAQRPLARPQNGGSLGAILWGWVRKLLAVSFMASMIAIGQYFYTYFVKKWETEGLPQMPIGVLRGSVADRAASSSAPTGGTTLLGGPSTQTSATSPRPGTRLNYEEYRD